MTYNFIDHPDEHEFNDTLKKKLFDARNEVRYLQEKYDRACTDLRLIIDGANDGEEVCIKMPEGGKLFLIKRPDPNPSENDDGMDHKALSVWYATHGTSGYIQTIVAHMLGLDVENYYYPTSNSDFLNCESLMEAVPGIRRRLPELAEKDENWKLLVETWDQIAEVDPDMRNGFIKNILDL
jgi:hypothetical protein